jgi:hypothetical protein
VRRRRLALAGLAAVLLGLSGCAFLVVTGPPEDNSWEVADHGRPAAK